MERFALITNMYLACGGERFLRQRVAEALAVSDTRRLLAGCYAPPPSDPRFRTDFLDRAGNLDGQYLFLFTEISLFVGSVKERTILIGPD
jgi:hypothetical protein